MQFKKLVIAAVLTCVSFGCAEEHPPKSIKAGVSFEVFSVVAQPAENTKELKDPDSGNALHLVTPPVITGKDIAAAGVHDDDGTTMFDVRLKQNAGKKMETATAQIGGNLAVVVDGEIVAAPKVVSKIGSQFKISGHFSKAEWEAILE